MRTIDKRPIAPTLKEMEIGKTEKFPHIQYDGICQGIYRLQTKFKAEGMQFRHTTTEDAIEVTRIA